MQHNDPQFFLTPKAWEYLDNPPRAASVNPFSAALARRLAADRSRFHIIPPRRAAESLSPAA